MNTILHLTDADFNPFARAGDRETYYKRGAARAIVRNADGAVAIMHASLPGYYKLPGGGIDEGEETIDALHREILEEVGAKIAVTGEIGIVLEHRDFDQMTQTSYAYTATVDGDIGDPVLTDKEISQGFQVVWAQDIDEAIKLIESSNQHDDMGIRFMNTRDIGILRAGKNLQK